MPQSTYLIIKAPPCSWLGTGRKALIADGSTHKHDFKADWLPGKPNFHGLWCALRVGLAKDAAEFLVEGDMSSGARIYRKSDKRQWREPDHDKRDIETPIHLWGCVEKSEWAKSYIFNADGTLSPSRNPTNVCLGVKNENGQAVVILVARSDTRRRLVFGGGAEMDAYFAELRLEATTRQAQREALEAQARSLLTPPWCTALREDGYARLAGVIAPELVRKARAEINRQLGQSNHGTDAFKAKTFATNPAITALIKESAVPRVLSELLGGDPDHYRARCGVGQLALRFPGDMCPDGWQASGKVSQAHFDGVRKGWHIDGCPNDFIPGVTDHFGVIQNFDVLVGVLLSDVLTPMSGELVVYPGARLRTFVRPARHLCGHPVRADACPRPRCHAPVHPRRQPHESRVVLQGPAQGAREASHRG